MAKFFSDLLINTASQFRKRRNCNILSLNEEGIDNSGSTTLFPKKGDLEDQNNILTQPGFCTKSFVLIFLLIYMTTTAMIFTFIQETWNFLDSFYFCLITLVSHYFFFINLYYYLYKTFLGYDWFWRFLSG